MLSWNFSRKTGLSNDYLKAQDHVMINSFPPSARVCCLTNHCWTNPRFPRSSYCWSKRECYHRNHFWIGSKTLTSGNMLQFRWEFDCESDFSRYPNVITSSQRNDLPIGKILKENCWPNKALQVLCYFVTTNSEILLSFWCVRDQQIEGHADSKGTSKMSHQIHNMLKKASVTGTLESNCVPALLTRISHYGHHSNSWGLKG